MNYKKIDNKDIEYMLSVINDKERVFFGKDISEDYSHDELSATKIMPEVVVQALNTEEISKIMKYAHENRIPVTPRGAGSGYALKDLMVGSEGTLGIITKAILKLLPLPKKIMSLLIPFPNLDMAISTVPEIIKSKSIPTAIEFMQREVIVAAEKFLGKKFPDNSSDAYLLLKFDGNSIEEIEKDYEYVAKLCLQRGALDVYISNIKQREEAIWSARGVFLEAIKADTSEMDEVDIVVPRNRVADFIKYVHELEEKHQIRLRSFGHAGDGNLHVYILKDELTEDVWQKKLEEVMEDMYKKQRELRGQVSGEHGIGLAKKPYLSQSLSPITLNLMRGIKSTFDPNNILNPGKIF